MATDSPFFINETRYYDYEEPQYVNKPAQIGCWIVFIILTLILNAVVIACIFRLYSKKPSTRFGSPKLLVILVCCVMQIVDAVVPSAMGVHINRIDRGELKATFTCGSLVFLELSSFMLSAMVTLLIAIVIVMEGLKFQRLVKLSAKMQMGAALLLLVLAGVYALVVVTPVFFLLWLEDGANPCSEHYFGLNISGDEGNVKVIHMVSYVIPHCGVLAAFVLLLVVYLTRRRNAFPPGYVQYYPAPVQVDKTGGPYYPPGSNVNATGDVTTTTTTATPDVSNPTNDVSSSPTVDDTANPPSTGPPVVHIATPTPTPQPQPLPQPQGENPLEEAVGFPWYTLLAAIVSLVLGFLFFFSQFQQLNLTLGERRRLWAAGVLLMVLRGVLLPCCWLVDKDLRSAWTCCSGARSAGHADPDRSQQEIMVRL